MFQKGNKKKVKVIMQFQNSSRSMIDYTTKYTLFNITSQTYEWELIYYCITYQVGLAFSLLN